MDQRSKTIWVDIICAASALRLLELCRKKDIAEIQYFQCTAALSPFLKVLAGALKVNLKQVDLVAGELTIEGASAYELIQKRITSVLDGFVGKQEIVEDSSRFTHRHGFNDDKFKAHLKEASYYLVYRPIEMSILAQKTPGDNIFLIKNTPLAGYLKETLTGRWECYTAGFFAGGRVLKRSLYYYDKLQKDYYASRWYFIFKLAGWHMLALMDALFTGGFRSNGGTNIGVELSQKEIQLDMMNDIYWLRESGIPLDNVCGLEVEDFDEPSRKSLREEGIRPYKINNHIVNRIRNYFRYRHSAYPAKSVSVDRRFIGESAREAGRLLGCIFSWNAQGWLHFQETLYYLKSAFWQNVYGQLGIKLLWTMYDIHPDKLTKGQAIERLGGIYLGGHWSNFPLRRIDNQKCYDVVLTWGEHFIRHHLNRYPHLAVMAVGYPCDHYFKDWRSRAEELRRGFPASAFVLSYMDNVMSNDLPYSMNMQVGIHKMLIELLRKYEHLYVMLKSKRRHVFEELSAEYPEIHEWISKGRIRAVWGETAKLKAVPAYVGMASDLVIGLGISTTAAECFFAGTVGFHADLTSFRDNEFGKKGDGVIVFRKMEQLKLAIENRINGNDRRTHGDYKPFYEMLDPFQDGQSYRRMGFIIRRLQECLSRGAGRERAVEEVKKDYEDHKKSHYKLEEVHQP